MRFEVQWPPEIGDVPIRARNVLCNESLGAMVGRLVIDLQPPTDKPHDTQGKELTNGATLTGSSSGKPKCPFGGYPFLVGQYARFISHSALGTASGSKAAAR